MHNHTRSSTPRCLGLTLVTGFALLSASPAHAAADDLPLTVYCSSGSLKTCAAVRIVTTANAVGGTSVMVWIQNLAGVAPDNTTASYLTKFGLSLPQGGFGTVSGFGVASDGATEVGNAAAEWSIGTQGAEIGSPEFLTIAGTPLKDGAIQGCTLSSNPTIYFQTCGQGSFVKFSFETSTRWFAENAEVAWKVQGAGLDGASLECVVGGTGDKLCLPGTAVPEPGTIVLLASGLVGLAAVQFRRRKRGPTS